MTPHEMTAKLARRFPMMTKDQATINEWREHYQRSLRSVNEDQLEEAFDKTMAAWSDTFSPPPAKVFLDNVRWATSANQGENEARMRASLPKPNRFDLAEKLPGLIGECTRHWWKANGRWADELFERAEKQGRDRKLVEDSLRTAIKESAHTHAQRVYWGKAQAADFKISDYCMQTLLPWAMEKQQKAA